MKSGANAEFSRRRFFSRGPAVGRPALQSCGGEVGGLAPREAPRWLRALPRGLLESQLQVSSPERAGSSASLRVDGQVTGTPDTSRAPFPHVPLVPVFSGYLLIPLPWSHSSVTSTAHNPEASTSVDATSGVSGTNTALPTPGPPCPAPDRQGVESKATRQQGTCRVDTGAQEGN